MVRKAVADTPNALKTVAEASVAAALHVDTTMRKISPSMFLMPFLCHSLLFLSIDLTVTMIWALRSPNTNVK